MFFACNFFESFFNAPAFFFLVLEGNRCLKSDFDNDMKALLQHLHHQLQQSHLTLLIALMQSILSLCLHLLYKYAPFVHRLSDIQKAVKLIGFYYGYLIRKALLNKELYSLLVKLHFVMNL